MKTYALHLKNIAVLIMFCSLLALLLPFLEIATGSKSTQISGFEILKVGAEAGYEYVNQGELREDYIIKGDLTWGEVKSTVASIVEAENLHINPQFQKIVLILIIAILPVLLCMIAMITTLFATGKLSMILPTICVFLAFVENFLFIIQFHRFQELLFFGQNNETVHLSILVGFYLFTILCGAALFILSFLWISGGFKKSVLEEDDSTKKKEKLKSPKSTKKQKKDKTTKRKKRRSKPVKKKRDKSKNKKREHTNKKEQEKEVLTDNKKSKSFGVLTGKVKGLSGMYQDITIDLTKSLECKVILGTVPEMVNFVENDKLDSCSLKIEYNMENQKYRIQSSSSQHILIKYKDGTQELLRNREIKIIDKRITLYVETVEHAIQLR